MNEIGHKLKKQSRRRFLETFFSMMLSTIFCRCKGKPSMSINSNKECSFTAEIFRSVNGTPSQNLQKVIELAGGIANIIGSGDVVVIKPNLQWWNQGSPNISVCKELVDSIMQHPDGFTGEVIFGENTHRGNMPWKKTAWAKTFSINSDLTVINNFNELCKLLKEEYKDRFTVSHWIDCDVGGRRVYDPSEGAGYVYCDGTGGIPRISMDNGLSGESRREVVMSYPIIKTDKGTIVDLKNGIWKENRYSDQPLKFINLAALNHHSVYCGMTSSIKNYFGVTDISYGADPYKGGKLSGNFYNFHAFAFNEWTKGPVPGIMGKEIGYFMNKIRKADLNITTAEWVGLVSRTEKPIAHTRAVMASRDPVALDFHAAKYLLYSNSGCMHHNPEWKDGPLFQYLSECAAESKLTMDELSIKIYSFNYTNGKLQNENKITVLGDIDWGSDIKTLLKYFLFRFGHQFLH